MENFVVSARKYRPITFDSVVGQSHITTTLKNAIATHHLAQAFLFCGPRGVGKTTCARILAKATNCQNLTAETEPCGACDSCISFQNNAALNFVEIDAASNNSVDDIRNLTDDVRYVPQTGKYKIYIIDEVHMLSSAAFNAFLKTLEEPPPYVIFILATTEKHKILPTILSRCQIFDFNRIQPKDISGHLATIAAREGIKAEQEALELIAQKADGGLRDALSMFDMNVTFSKDQTLRYKEVLENLHMLDYDYYFRMIDAFLESNLPLALLLFDEIIQKGFDGHLFISGLLEHLRNLLVCKDSRTAALLEVSETVRTRFLEQSARSSYSFLLSALSVGSQCDLQYKLARNQRLHVEICLMKIAHIPGVLDISALPDSGGTAKKKAETTLISVETGVDNPPSSGNQAISQQPVQEQVVQNVQSDRPQTRSNTKLKSTRELLAEKAKPAAVKAPEGSDSQDLPDRPVPTEADLNAAVRKFSKNRIAAGMSSSTEEVALSRTLTFTNQEIGFLLDNDLQLAKIDEIKTDLMAYLNSLFQMKGIRIGARVAPSEIKRMPYTPREKFDFLAEKNENLLELKRQLGLEIDF